MVQIIIRKMNRIRVMGNKRITLKGITVLVFTALIAAMFSGCVLNRPDTQRMLIKYMNNRYPDETFTVEWTDWISYDNEKYITTVHFSTDEFPDGVVEAYIAKENGVWIYRDNYILLRNKEEIEAAAACDKNDRYQLIRHAVDIRVIDGYKLWKNNYIT